jgi:hypothetical protein
MASQAKRTRPSGGGPRVGHLDSLSGILSEMGAVYREMRTGKTPIADGSRLIYSLKCMRDVLETVVLERIESRLEQLEGMRPHGHTASDRATVRTH